MKEKTLESRITQDIHVETHNDWKTFILHQSTIGNAQRPAVDNSIVMTQDQLAKLVAVQHGVQRTPLECAHENATPVLPGFKECHDCGMTVRR